MLILRLSKSFSSQFTVVMMFFPSYDLVVWKVSHISSCSSVVPQQNLLWMSVSGKISSHSYFLFSYLLFFEWAQSNRCNKRTNISWPYSFLEVKLRQCLKKGWKMINMIHVKGNNTLCLQTALIKYQPIKYPIPAAQYKMQRSNMFTEFFNLCPWRAISNT